MKTILSVALIAGSVLAAVTPASASLFHRHHHRHYYRHRHHYR